MRELKEVQDLIERARQDLNRSFLEDDFFIYYRKSTYLDKLIEEYLDILDEIQ